MKNITKIIILLFLASPAVQAQTFENELQKVTENLSRQINKKPYKNIVIYPFWDNKKQTSDMGNMITDKFWVSLVNETNNFEVMDRGQLEYYLVEHQLNSEGLINPLTAKQFGMLIAADAFVSGNYYVLKSYISLNIKVVDVETGKMVTTLSGKLPLNYEISEFLDIDNWQSHKEEINQNKSSNPNCDRQNVGDFCFENKTSKTYNIRINDISNTSPLSTMYRNLTVSPGQIACFRDLPLKTFNATIHLPDDRLFMKAKNTTFYVEQCGAGRHTIK